MQVFASYLALNLPLRCIFYKSWRRRLPALCDDYGTCYQHFLWSLVQKEQELKYEEEEDVVAEIGRVLDPDKEVNIAGNIVQEETSLTKLVKVTLAVTPSSSVEENDKYQYRDCGTNRPQDPIG